MAWTFGEGFDLYVNMSDPIAGYWDSGFGQVGGNTLVTGRFAGSQAVALSSALVSLVKSSGVNDSVHHIVCAFRQTAALSGSTLAAYFQLSDGVTNQVCVVFRSDGAILLTSATPAGTVLDTYTGAVNAVNTWLTFEFEVIISNTVGAFRARRNGNSSTDHDSGATLNTRPGTNSYANKLTLGQNLTLPNQQFDDIFWRSDASSVAWMGDIRCYTRMPASDASAQFSRSPNPVGLALGTNTTAVETTSQAHYTSFTATYSGTVGAASVNFGAGFTGNCKVALFADSGGGVPGTVLGSATAILSNPVSGYNAVTFSPAIAVTQNSQYWIGVSHDVSATLGTVNPGITGRIGTAVAYASFPSSNPSVGAANNPQAWTATLVPTVNTGFVNDTPQDGITSYVYDSTVGHADFYNIAARGASVTSVLAVTTRGFAAKSDAGTRNAAVQLKSGATTVQTTSTALTTAFINIWRTDVTDPNTSAAWTATAVDSVQIGPIVTV